jgi:hypothetical protein
MKTISTLRMKINQHRRWIAGTFLVAASVGAWAGFDQLMPKVPGGLANGQSRFGWYVHSGQWHADARTAVAVAQYVFSPDNSVLPTSEPVTNSQVAKTSPTPLPATGAARVSASNPS